MRLQLTSACGCFLLLVVVAATRLAAEDATPRLLERARALMKSAPLVDGHNDLPWELRTKVGYDLDRMDIRAPQPALQTDIPRLRAGHLGAQFWSVYVPSRLDGRGAVTATLEQIDAVHEILRRYPDVFEIARTAADVERIFRSGKIASLIGMEGGHSIDNSLAALRMFHRLGVGYMTLTHSDNVAWADSGTDTPRAGGLSRFGEAVVKEMNWLGMLVDLSHVSPDAMSDALRVSEAPVIFSHSSARALCDVPRNVPDEVLRQIPRNGGVVMVTFVPSFVSPEVAEAWGRFEAQRKIWRSQYADAAAGKAAEDAWRAANPLPAATLAQVADHIDHVRKVAGIDHVGIGSDFDGIESGPRGLEDVSKFPDLVAELLRRGYSDEDVRKVIGGNVLRVMREAEQVAVRLQKTRPPSVLTFEQADGKGQ
jgi:membrane dipeptidase